MSVSWPVSENGIGEGQTSAQHQVARRADFIAWLGRMAGIDG